MYPLIDKPTKVTQKSSTIIDNIYCNSDNLSDICKSGVSRFSISDHYAIFGINNSIKICDDTHTIIKREFNQKNISRFIKCVGKQSWISLNSLGVQSAFSWFQRVIDLHFGNSYPKRSFTLTYKNRLPWITEKLCTQIKDKNAMHTIFFASVGPRLARNIISTLNPMSYVTPCNNSCNSSHFNS